LSIEVDGRSIALSLGGLNSPRARDGDRVRVGKALTNFGFIANTTVGVLTDVRADSGDEDVNLVAVDGSGEGDNNGSGGFSILPSSVVGIERSCGEGRNNPSLSDFAQVCSQVCLPVNRDIRTAILARGLENRTSSSRDTSRFVYSATLARSRAVTVGVRGVCKTSIDAFGLVGQK